MLRCWKASPRVIFFSACILSIRTRDEVSLPIALRLFERVRTPAEFCTLDLDSLLGLIHGTSFAEAKAVQIAEIARRTIGEYGGELPADASVLMGFKGVGPKCAQLGALGVACGLPHISVDVHVWRIVNRWGYVSAPTPEATMLALENRLPQRYWIEINRLLVPFGKHVCTGTRPKCSTCPVLAYCRQVGVSKHPVVGDLSARAKISAPITVIAEALVPAGYEIVLLRLQSGVLEVRPTYLSSDAWYAQQPRRALRGVLSAPPARGGGVHSADPCRDRGTAYAWASRDRPGIDVPPQPAPAPGW